MGGGGVYLEGVLDFDVDDQDARLGAIDGGLDVLELVVVLDVGPVLLDDLGDHEEEVLGVVDDVAGPRLELLEAVLDGFGLDEAGKQPALVRQVVLPDLPLVGRVGRVDRFNGLHLLVEQHRSSNISFSS